MLKHEIKIWGNKPEIVDKINVWNKMPKNFIETIDKKEPEFYKSKTNKKRSFWGIRYAIYGFFLSIVLQTAVVLFSLGVITEQLAAEGFTVAESEVEALKRIQELGPALLMAQLSMYVGWIAAMFYVTYRKGLHSFAKDFWLRFKWRTDITYGILIAVGLRMAEIGIFSILGLLGINTEGADNSSQWQGNTLWAYIFMFGIVSFVGPFAEELFFRGLLLQGLLRNFRRRSFVPKTAFGDKIQRIYPPLWDGFSQYKNFLYKHKYSLAIIISSVWFGFMHFQGAETLGQWLVVILTGGVGAVLAYVTIKTKRLGMAIVAHIAFNFSGMFITLFV